MEGERRGTPVFRWSGSYWGFLLDDQLHDRYGRHVGWLDRRPGHGPDVFHLSGHFMGELVDDHYVLRNLLRTEPTAHAERPPVPVLAPPAPSPSRDAALRRDGWGDALPWPLRPPEPPRH